MLAKRYLSFGIILLEKRDGWATCYQEMITFKTHLARTEFSIGNFGDSQRCIQEILLRSRNLEDKIEAYLTKVGVCGSEGRVDDAISAGIQCLRELGEKIPSAPHLGHVAVQLVWAKQKLRNKTDSELLDVEIASNVRVVSMLKMYGTLAAMAWLSLKKNFFAFFILRLVRTSTKFGFYSAFPYSLYGMLLGVLRDYKEAHRFSRLALALGHRFSDDCNPPSLAAIHIFLAHLQEPYHDQIEPCLRTYKLGFKVGDTMFGAVAATGYLYFYFMTGLPLAHLVKDARHFRDEMLRYGQINFDQHSGCCHQAALNLVGEAPNPLVMTGGAMDEDEYQRIAVPSVLRNLHTCKMILGVYFNDFDVAGASADILRKESSDVDGTIAMSFFRLFFMGLAALRLAKETRKMKHFRLSRVIINKIRSFAKGGNVNCHHMLLLLYAEQSSVKKRRKTSPDSTETRTAYSNAIISATRSGFTNHAALAYERAARFFLNNGDLDDAGHYFNKAKEKYIEWGAAAKSKQIEVEFGLFLPADQARASSSFRQEFLSTSGGGHLRGRQRHCVKISKQHRGDALVTLGSEAQTATPNKNDDKATTPKHGLDRTTLSKTP